MNSADFDEHDEYDEDPSPVWLENMPRHAIRSLAPHRDVTRRNAGVHHFHDGMVRILGRSITPKDFTNPHVGAWVALSDSICVDHIVLRSPHDCLSEALYRGERWYEAEPVILSNRRAAVVYAVRVIRGEWLAMEQIMANHSTDNNIQSSIVYFGVLYAKMCNRRMPWVEQWITPTSTDGALYSAQFPDFKREHQQKEARMISPTWCG